MKDEPRNPRTKIRVSSINIVIPGEDDSSENQPNMISIVQQSSVIVNRFRDNQSTGRQDSTAE